MKNKTVLVRRAYAEFDNGRVYKNVTRSSIARLRRLAKSIPFMGGWRMLTDDPLFPFRAQTRESVRP